MSLFQKQDDNKSKKGTTTRSIHPLENKEINFTQKRNALTRKSYKEQQEREQDQGKNGNRFLSALSPIINHMKRKISSNVKFTNHLGELNIEDRRKSVMRINDIHYTNKSHSNTNTNTNTMLSQIHKTKRPRWKRKMEKFLNSTPVLATTSIITVYALFGSDIQNAWTRPNVDLGFNVSQTIIFVFFIIEFILNCLCIQDYIFSFFFWLDLIATVSFIQDLDYIMNVILGYGPTTVSTKSSIQAAKAVQKVAQATRATRVLRVIRIIRLIRMIKIYKNIYTARENKARKLEEEKKRELEQKEREMIEASSGDNSDKTGSDSNSKKEMIHLNRIDTFVIDSSRSKHQGGATTEANVYSSPVTTNVNLIQLSKNDNRDKFHEGNQYMNECLSPNKRNHRSSSKKISAKLGSSSVNNKTGDEEDEEEIIKESKISKIITEANTKKVIFLILVLLIIFPILSEDFYNDDSAITYNLLSEYISSFTSILNSSDPVNSPFLFYGELIDPEFPLVNISINGSLIYNNDNFTSDYFRYKELRHVYSNNGLVHIAYSLLTETKMTGWLNIIQTIFVCLCLTIITVSLENLAKKLLLNPLEIMIEIVDTVAKNPMNAANVENLKNGIKAEINGQSINEKKTKKGNDKDKDKDKDDNGKDTEENYELNVIKTALIKISALLAIGFGEAGGEIITKNLSMTQDLNTKLKGKKKQAIFGFCDIRQFEQLTLALEEGIMIFVNQIAEIVHSSVDTFGGATNKNIGEAFLNVWKFYNETPIKEKEMKEKRMQRKDNLLKIDPTNPKVGIIADMSVLGFLRVLLKINKSQHIIKYRSNEKINELIPNFRLSMGFGLHLGYGIEGAVGSTYKFDASYLSPNVNIAARLESATRQFGIPLLFSGVLYNLLTPELKQLCRFIDCVKVKGSLLPLDLYTIDLNLDVTPEKETKVIKLTNKDKKNYYADKKDMLKREVAYWGSITKLILSRNSYLEMLRTKKTNEFYLLWDDGMKQYKNGNFKKAHQYFDKCLKIDNTDGPAKTLMKFIESCGYKASDDWEGTRELLAK